MVGYDEGRNSGFTRKKVKTNHPNHACGQPSIYAGVLRADHSSPRGLPFAARSFEYENVAAVVIEGLASHFVSDLIRVDRYSGVVERIHRKLADLESLNYRLCAEVRVAGHASFTALSALREVRVDHHDVFAKERRKRFGIPA